MNILFRFLIVSACVISFSGSSSAEGLKLSFSDVTEVSALPNIEKSPKDQGFGKTERKFSVFLYPESLAIEADGQVRIYDFQSKRMKVLTPSKSEIYDISLYSIPIFKVRERQNRISLNRALSSTGIASSLPDVQEFDVDMVFGSDKDSQATAALLSRKVSGGDTVFEAGGRELVRFSLSDKMVPENLRDSYYKFLVYEVSVHPVVKKEIVKNAAIIKALTFENRETEIEKTSYSLNAVEVVPEASYPVGADVSKSYSFDPALKDVLSTNAGDTVPGLDKYKTDILAYADEGLNVDAMLALSEMLLVHADKISEEQAFLQKSVNAIKNDPDAMKALGIIRSMPTDEAGLMAAAAYMSGLKAKAKHKAYLLDFFMANHIRAFYRGRPVLAKAQMDRLVATIPAYLETVKRAPYLAGAFYDFGSAYYDDFDMVNAWACWDQVRRIAPNFAMLKSVQDMEQRLQVDFPEYF